MVFTQNPADPALQINVPSGFLGWGGASPPQGLSPRRFWEHWEDVKGPVTNLPVRSRWNFNANHRDRNLDRVGDTLALFPSSPNL